MMGEGGLVWGCGGRWDHHGVIPASRECIPKRLGGYTLPLPPPPNVFPMMFPRRIVCFPSTFAGMRFKAVSQ